MDRPPEMAQTQDPTQYGAKPTPPDPPPEFVERAGDAALHFLLHPEQ